MSGENDKSFERKLDKLFTKLLHVGGVIYELHFELVGHPDRLIGHKDAKNPNKNYPRDELSKVAFTNLTSNAIEGDKICNILSEVNKRFEGSIISEMSLAQFSADDTYDFLMK